MILTSTPDGENKFWWSFIYANKYKGIRTDKMAGIRRIFNREINMSISVPTPGGIILN
jgi:hypothetical protein